MKVIYTSDQPQRQVLESLVPIVQGADSATFISFKSSTSYVLHKSGFSGVKQLHYHRLLQHFGFDIKFEILLNDHNKKTLIKLMEENPEPIDWRSENGLPEDIEIFKANKMICRWQWDIGMTEVDASKKSR